MELLGVQRTALAQAIQRGDFPKPIVIFSHGRARAWAEDEVMSWLEARLATRGE